MRPSDFGTSDFFRASGLGFRPWATRGKTSLPSFKAALTSLPLVAALLAGPAYAAQNGGLNLQFSVQDQPVTVTVSGTVRDKRSAEPIPNALVRAHVVLRKQQGPELFEKCPAQETVTGAKGEYQLQFQTPLTATGPGQGKDLLCVYASAPGYGCQPHYVRPHVTARTCTFTNQDFQLKPGKPLRGVVVNAAGQPVAGAVVRVQISRNGDWNFFGSLGRTLTGEDGSFQLWLDAGGDDLGSAPWLCILKPGSGFLFVWDILVREDLGTLTLNSGGELTGKVVGANGLPVPNCEVLVRNYPCDLIDKAMSGPDGTYHLKGIPGKTSIAAFHETAFGSYVEGLGKLDVYARPVPDMNLKDAPNFQISAKDGEAVPCPDLVVGTAASVSGVLLRSKTALSLGGLLVRLDGKWDNMVETDLNGHFLFPFVQPGKRTLTAYLPDNLRYGRGIGQSQIEVQAGSPLKDVAIQLVDLAELRVQYLDAKGNPLAGITAGATWSKSGDGAWTEGTVSGDDGWAVLYLYPGSTQYVRGFDSPRTLTAETVREINPQPAQVLTPLTIVMVPTASLSGRLLDQQGEPLVAKRVLGNLSLADGFFSVQRFKTEADGRFQLQRITPGVLKLSLEIDGVIFTNVLGQPREVRPGQSEALGDLVLKDALNKAKVSREKQAQALVQPQELTRAAHDFFDKIRTANYAAFLKPDADWQQFPIVGSYETYKWFDTLVSWMSTTFSTNPIVNIELGQPFGNPKSIGGQKNLPTVPYKLTLQNGALLQGNLPFQYNFKNQAGHWFALHGIDWHLQKQTNSTPLTSPR